MAIGGYSDLDPADGPIDVIERISRRQRWKIQRWGDEAATVAVNGVWQNCTIAVSWSAESEVLMLTIPVDLKIIRSRLVAMRRLVAAANSLLMLGHFDFVNRNSRLALRYSLILSDSQALQEKHLTRLLAILCEALQRFFPAIHLVLEGAGIEESLNAALIEPEGRA